VNLLDEVSRTQLFDIGKPCNYKTGEIIFQQGETSGHVVVITSGHVKVTSGSPAGYEAMLAIRDPGDILGELAALDHNPRSATVTALEPVQGFVIPGAAFKRFLDTHPVAASILARLVVRRLREANMRRAQQGAYPVSVRLARLLVELRERYGVDSSRGTIIDILLSQQELAGMVGASLEAIVKALRRLRDNGVITTHRRHITILREDALRAIQSPDDDQ
jgi:CRP/FNR family transcriptional regulator, cyclic AMP receptor protein